MQKPLSILSAAFAVLLLAFGIAKNTDASNFSYRGEFDYLNDLKSSTGFASLVNWRAQDNPVAHNGAIGRNVPRFKDVAAQRGAGLILMQGVLKKDSTLIESAVQAFEYAFDQQSSLGNFNNNWGYDPKTAVPADVFFLQAFARSYLLLRDSEFWEEYGARFERLLPKLKKAMTWLAAHDQIDELLRQDRNAANRLWFDALAFSLNGLILENLELQSIGRRFVNAGLEQQRPDGSFNEHKGYDTSYQAVSLLNMSILYSYSNDELLRKILYQAIDRAENWESIRILPNGEVSTQGNARTGEGQEIWFGGPKEVNYFEVANAFFYSSLILKSDSTCRYAELIVKYIAGKKHK